MRVLHLLNSDRFSGAESVVCQIIEMFRETQDVDMAYCSRNGQIQEILREREIDFFPISKMNISEVKRVIRAYKPDLIHAHDYTAGIICVFSGTKIPIINHIHNNSLWIKHYDLKSIIYYLSTLRYRTILTVSNSIADEYVFGDNIRNKVINIGNPVDIDKIKKLAEKDHLEVFDVIYLSRLSEAKNPLLFVEIIKELKKTNPTIKVAMIGDGELRSKVEIAIKRNSLSSNIKLLGFLSNPFPVLKSSRVMCMTSKWEGFGLAAAEAITLGIPVVSSPVGGLKDIIDSTCGFFCASKQEFVDKINEIIINEDLYYKLHLGAINKSKKFKNNSYYNTMYNIYRKTISKL